jgi:hypothetical protein
MGVREGKRFTRNRFKNSGRDYSVTFASRFPEDEQWMKFDPVYWSSRGTARTRPTYPKFPVRLDKLEHAVG